MYSKEEREVAKKICDNKEYLELIAKVFLDSEDSITTEFVNTKTNQELGEIVRAGSIAEQKIKSRYQVLKMLAQPVPSGKPKPAGKA